METILLINKIFAIAFVSSFSLSILFMVLYKFIFKKEKMQDISMVFLWITMCLFFSLAIISGIHQYLQIHN